VLSPKALYPLAPPAYAFKAYSLKSLFFPAIKASTISVPKAVVGCNLAIPQRVLNPLSNLFAPSLCIDLIISSSYSLIGRTFLFPKGLIYSEVQVEDCYTPPLGVPF
jgi:hypothetical protein